MAVLDTRMIVDVAVMNISVPMVVPGTKRWDSRGGDDR
jgi:hypothetical protein